MNLHERLMGDINGDGKSDIVGFGDSYVMAATSNGSLFVNYSSWTSDFSINDGWENDKHVRLLADIDGDNKEDIVGFGDLGVEVGISNGTSFNPPILSIAYLGYNGFQPNGGWRNDRHIRTIGKINNDDWFDVIGFGDHGVVVGISQGNGDFTFSIWSDKFGFYDGYDTFSDYDPIRLVGDVNGDEQDDIIGFGKKGVEVALSNGFNAFEYDGYWIHNFGYFSYAGGWKNYHPRLLADVNGDGKDDTVGFGDYGTLISLSTGNTFLEPITYSDFGNLSSYGGWSIDDHIRTLADIDNDGRVEIVGFGNSGVLVLNCGYPSETFRLGNISSQIEIESELPTLTSYPNPFTDFATISFSLQTEEMINLIVYDFMGKQVRSIIENKRYSAGNHKFKWAPKEFGSGIYHVILHTQNHTLSKMIYLK